MKNLNNIYIKGDTIYSKGPSSAALNFINYFFSKEKNIKSFLDVGCGDGILMKLMNKKIEYLGIDSDAGIKKKKINSNIKYFKNPKTSDTYLKKLKKKYDCVALMDVLEHTDKFIDLFEISLKKTNKYVIVCLPNEDYIQSRIRFLFGHGIKTHGLDLVNSKPGHKHQWLIQYQLAKEILNNSAKKFRFQLINTVFFVGLPGTFYKRLIYKFFLNFIPKRIQMNEFCFIFKKNN